MTIIYVVFAAVTKGEHRPHRDQLIKIPKRYQDLQNHPYGELFKKAYRVELRNLIRKKTWTLIIKAAVGYL